MYTIDKDKFYIIRTFSAGIWFAKVKEIIETPGNLLVTIIEARNLWYYSGAHSLVQLAEEGVKNANNCKFTQVINDEVLLTQVTSILPCSDTATTNLQNVSVWKAK